jgi:molybdate transport system ATP-binding protein
VSGLGVAARLRLREFELDVELEVAPGERLALVGPSGAGKSTVMRVAAGLLAPQEGRVALDGEVWLDTAAGIDLAPERRRCGYLFQEYALFPQMNALRNVAFGIRGAGRAARRRRALELLDRFGCGELAEALPGALSGGERQRVALARALAPQPAVLLLDEPLSALDPANRSAALRELDSLLAGLEIPIVVVSHSFEEAALIGERIVVVDRGSVVQRGTAAEVSAEPVSAFVADFTGAVVLRGRASSDPDGLTAIALEGGGTVRSTDRAEGPVALCVFPWEISLEPPGAAHSDSALNRIDGEVRSLTEVGNRVRVGISLPQVLTAEVTARSVAALGLRRGSPVTASWKATATRVLSAG